MLKVLKSRFFQKCENPVFRVSLGILLFFLLFLSYRSYTKYLSIVNYRLFNLSESVSWYETDKGLVRLASKGTLDNLLLSSDDWTDLEMSFNLMNPNVASLLFHYKDDNNFDFVFLNPKVHLILLGEKINGSLKTVGQSPFSFATEQSCQLDVRGKEVAFSMNGKELFKKTFKKEEGKIGFILNEAFEPQTIFNDIQVDGVLKDGREHLCP